MGLLGGSNKNAENMEDQIKILATNIEVLNQKLISDPNAAISPGEAIIKNQIASALAKLDEIQKEINATDKASPGNHRPV